MFIDVLLVKLASITPKTAFTLSLIHEKTEILLFLITPNIPLDVIRMIAAAEESNSGMKKMAPMLDDISITNVAMLVDVAF